MSSTKLFNPVHVHASMLFGNQNVISAGFAADKIKVARNTFFKAMAGKVIIPQVTIQSEPGRQPVYGFEIDYLEDISKILKKYRGKSKEVFNEHVKLEIAKLNEEWRKKTESWNE